MSAEVALPIMPPPLIIPPLLPPIIPPPPLPEPRNGSHAPASAAPRRATAAAIARSAARRVILAIRHLMGRVSSGRLPKFHGPRLPRLTGYSQRPLPVSFGSWLS